MAKGPQEEDYSIHWISDVVERVLERNAEVNTISTGKSTSGTIHIGFMRELITADVISRELQRLGRDAKTLFVVDDYDPVRAFPPGISLPLDEWVGIPYSDVPDEFGCCDSFGAHWANELIETFPDFGVDPEIVWNSKLYETPEMQAAVRMCLKHTETLREIMIEYVARDFNEEQRAEYIKSMKVWYPGSVICPVCGRLQAGVKGEIVPNRITNYNPETDKVSFQCPSCGHSDETPLRDLKVKLSWRVDWPAKWYVLNVTCEPAGKDHAVKGGSYDTGLEVSRRVFGWDGPVKVPFEWVRIGGRDMATSEGIVFSPKVWLKIAPPELYRFLMLRTDLERAINIMPERIPDMIDEYDRFERIYYGEEEADEPRQELARLLYPLTESRAVRSQYAPRLPFKFAIVTSQLEPLLGHETVVERCKEVIRKQYSLSEVSETSLSMIPTRLKRAHDWAMKFGSKNDRVEISDSVPKQIRVTITDEDRKFLGAFVEVLKQPGIDEDGIQTAIFEKAREVNMKEKRAFVALYRVLISRKSGPRLGPFVMLLGTDWVKERIQSVI